MIYNSRNFWCGLDPRGCDPYELSTTVEIFGVVWTEINTHKGKISTTVEIFGVVWTIASSVFKLRSTTVEIFGVVWTTATFDAMLNLQQ